MNNADILFTENTDLAIYKKAFPLMVKQVLGEMLAVGEDVQNEPYHQFAPGVYARELFIGKNQLIVGKVHKTEHFNIISKGEASVATEEGVIRVKAPYTFVSKAGTQKVVYAHEDVVWTTIHATNETNVEKLEADLVETYVIEKGEIE